MRGWWLGIGLRVSIDMCSLSIEMRLNIYYIACEINEKRSN